MRLFGLIALMFAVLVGFTSRWTIFQASALRENPLNRRQLLESERIQRGPIVAADGTVLARSVPASEGTYTRVYPTGELFSHAVGYYYTNLGSSGLERTANRSDRAHRDEPAVHPEPAPGQGNRGRQGGAPRSIPPPSASPNSRWPATRARSPPSNRAPAP